MKFEFNFGATMFVTFTGVNNIEGIKVETDTLYMNFGEMMNKAKQLIEDYRLNYVDCTDTATGEVHFTAYGYDEDEPEDDGMEEFNEAEDWDALYDELTGRKNINFDLDEALEMLRNDIRIALGKH